MAMLRMPMTSIIMTVTTTATTTTTITMMMVMMNDDSDVDDYDDGGMLMMRKVANTDYQHQRCDQDEHDQQRCQPSFFAREVADLTTFIFEMQ